jgi:hypothetical protein
VNSWTIIVIINVRQWPGETTYELVFSLNADQRKSVFKSVMYLKSSFFWDITPCCSLKTSQYFEVTCHFHLQSWRVIQARNQPEGGSRQSSGRLSLLPASCWYLASSLAYFSTMKMEATCSSKISVGFQRNIWHYIPEDRTLHNQCCENLKSYNDVFVSW